MVQCGVVQDMHSRMNSSGLGILGAVHQAPDTGVHYGPGAHGAGLNGHEQIATWQAMISDGCAGLAQGNDLGMSGWIGIREVAVEAPSNDFSFVDDDGAHRNFAGVQCALG